MFLNCSLLPSTLLLPQAIEKNVEYSKMLIGLPNYIYNNELLIPILLLCTGSSCKLGMSGPVTVLCTIIMHWLMQFFIQVVDYKFIMTVLF